MGLAVLHKYVWRSVLVHFVFSGIRYNIVEVVVVFVRIDFWKWN